MIIYILTYKRSEVKTLRYIPPSWYDRLRLVVQQNDKTLENKYPEVKRCVLPPEIRDIGATRQYLVDHSPEQHIMQLDDDLTISVLRDPGAYNLRDASHEDVDRIFRRMDNNLYRYPHIGACARAEAHIHFKTGERECGRAIRFHAMDTKWFRTHGIDITRVPTIEDYDFILQILRTGTPNLIDCQVYVGDGGSNAEGGCSEIRATVEDGHYARRLAELHPGLVKLVTKTTKGWTRTDVQISWKKAYETALI